MVRRPARVGEAGVPNLRRGRVGNRLGYVNDAELVAEFMRVQQGATETRILVREIHWPSPAKPVTTWTIAARLSPDADRARLDAQARSLPGLCHSQPWHRLLSRHVTRVWRHRYPLNRTRFWLAVVAVVTPFGNASSAWAQRSQDIHALCPDSASEAAIVTGTVADEMTGHPIPAVTVRTSARQFCAQFSDSLGRFRLRVPPGTQRISAGSRAGFLGTEGPELALATADSTDISLILRRDPEFSGEPPALVDAYPAARWPDWFYGPMRDSLLEVADLERLDLSPLPDGEREIRVWSDIAIGSPKDLVILKDQAANPHGEVILYWRTSIDENDSLDARHTAELGPKCKRLERGNRWVVCYLNFTTEPDWTRLLNDATDAGVWTLPDPFTLPYEGSWVLDGWSMTVEVRDGEHYRAYHYSNPDAYDWPETRQAVALMEIFNRPWRQVFD